MSVWKPTEKIKYIDNNQKNGILIDWDKVRKAYNKLGIPETTHNPIEADVTKFGYIIDMSERSRGKTTNKLIVGLLLFKMYGIELIYIRQSKFDTAPKVLHDLYQTVTNYGYITKIFGQSYNDIEYYGKRWRLIKRDGNGDITDKCTEHCTFCVGLDENDSLKSSFNAPKGDILFFDEFISTYYGYNDFFRFADICKTVIRDRISPVIFMSANTINIDSPWFDELAIKEDVETMKQGDKRYIVSEMGTHIYVEILSPDTSKERASVNTRFWGFKNPKLISITGKGEWATENYPHIPVYDKDHVPETLHDILFIRMSNKYVKLRLVEDEEIGVCVFVVPATRVYDDSIILTIDDITKRNELFGFGKGTFCDAYWKLYYKNKFFYANNRVGSFVSTYISSARTKMNTM